MILKNAKIYTMEKDEIIENGFVEIKDGKILKVDDMKNLKSKEEGIDLEGMNVFPGFIDAHCHVGVLEDSLCFEGDDTNEATDPVTPHLRGIDAVNPFDVCFKEAREAGVTTVSTGPGSANVIAGTFTVLKTFGVSVDDMAIKKESAMKFAFGENPKNTYNAKGQTPITRMGAIALIREQLKKALEYKETLNKYNENPDENDKPEFDMKCESLLPLLNGEMPMKAHAHRADDILSAIRIAKEFNLKLTLDHCTEGHLIKEKLKEANCPCLIGPSIIGRSKPELKNKTYETPKILAKEGIEVSIITDHDVIPIEHLPLCAALAHREGLSYTDAIKAITINPAKALGIDNLVGSIKKGKDADLVVIKGDPLNVLNKPNMVFINGINVMEEK